MPIRFVNPNFHVILIHYPLGLFAFGLFLEVFSFLWKTSSVRNAARWMILIGALSSLVAATSGIYALSDVSTHQQITAERYAGLKMHVIFESAGAMAAVIVTVFGLASADSWRRKLHYPMLAVLMLAAGLFVVGSWYGGEQIYTQGVAVAYNPKKAKPKVDVSEDAGTTTAPASSTAADSSADKPKVKKHNLTYYTGDPVQLHMITAGLGFAIAFGALGLSFRKITSLYPDIHPITTIATAEPTYGVPPSGEAMEMVHSFEPHGEALAPVVVEIDPILPAGRFWLLSALIALAAAGGGFWVWAGNNDSWSLSGFWEDVIYAGNKFLFNRASIHVWVGIAIILLSLILAILSRWATKKMAPLAIISALLVIAIAAQVWLGILLQFDGIEGPLLKFSPESKDSASIVDYSGQS